MKQILLSIFACSLLLTAFGQETIQKNHHPANWKKFKTQKVTENRLHLPSKLTISSINNLTSTDALMQKMDSLVVSDSYSGQEENSIKDSFTYNYLGLITSFTESDWNLEQSKWIDTYQSVLNYDANWNLAVDISYDRDIINNQWVALSKEVYSYNENHKLNLTTGYLWSPDSESWLLYYKDEYSYTSNTETGIRYSWNDQSQEWVIGYKSEYQYDTEGKLVLHTSFAWNPVVSIWENLDKDEYTYNSNGKLETQILSFWYVDSQTWEFSEKEQYTYNTEGDMIMLNSYEWRSWAKGWDLYYKEEPTYNNMFTFNELLVPYLFENNEVYFNHMLTSFSAYEYYESIWLSLGVVSFYYSEIDITGIRDHQHEEPIIFPNPAQNQISLSWNENTPSMQLEIYNASGVLVSNQRVDNFSAISISHLPEGLYLFKLSDKQTIRYLEKIIIY